MVILEGFPSDMYSNLSRKNSDFHRTAIEDLCLNKTMAICLSFNENWIVDRINLKIQRIFLHILICNIISVGNPKKFEKLTKLQDIVVPGKSETGDNVTKVYKDPNHLVKEALEFRTKEEKSKLT